MYVFLCLLLGPGGDCFIAIMAFASFCDVCVGFNVTINYLLLLLKFLDILIAKRHCFDSIVLVFLFRWHTAERYLAM
jgi:hypothetical protein